MIRAEEIQAMPLREKLQVMEALWDDIASQDDVLEMPQWQKNLLDERERMVAEGKAEFVDWEVAKEHIAKATR